MRGINKKIDSFIKKKKCTLLGVGPMRAKLEAVAKEDWFYGT